MHCPLCNYEFDAQEMSCHASCAFNHECAVICCPNCGYQMVDESKSRLAGWLRNRLAARRKPAPVHAPGLTPISALRAGQSAVVVMVEGENTNRQERLGMYGLIPGMTVTLHRRQPTFVLHIGYTELSLEREVADSILVEPVES